MPVSNLTIELFSKPYSTSAHVAGTMFLVTLLKPRLFDSGACHRLALIEGQKEMARRTKPCRKRGGNKMKILGKKMFFSILFMCFLLTVGSTGSVCIADSQHPKEGSAVINKTLSILDDVVGLDTDAYNVNVDSYGQTLYFEVLPQEDIKIYSPV